MNQTSVEGFGSIRGWLLVWVVVLIPHGVSALGMVLLPEVRAAAHGGVGLATLVIMAAGNLGGIILILARARIAPVFFTIYPPLLLALTLFDRELLGTVNARFAALGLTQEITSVQLAAVLAVNTAIVVLMVGYWTRSKRVRAVFGTTGLELLRRRSTGGEPGL